MPHVYIPNKSAHDFSKASAFGELVYITEGLVNRYKVNQIYRMCASAMVDAGKDDYILISSLSVINSIAAAIMAAKFGRVNFLIYNKDQNSYESREIVIN